MPGDEEFAELMKHFNTETFKTGSPSPPPLEKGTLRIYGMRFCSDVRKVILTVAAKKIPCEIMNIDIGRKPEWFVKEKNPRGSVPAIEKDGQLLSGSLVCCKFIDDEYADMPPKLAAVSPEEFRKQEQIVDELDRLDIYRAWLKDPENKELQKQVVSILELFEKKLPADRGYFGGTEPQWVDYMCWPYLERVTGWANLEKNGYSVFKVGQDKYPKLWKYVERMGSRPEVKLTGVSAEMYEGYAGDYTRGQGNFDFGLKL